MRVLRIQYKISPHGNLCRRSLSKTSLLYDEHNKAVRVLAHASQRKDEPYLKGKLNFALISTVICCFKYTWGTLSPIPPAKGNDSLWNPQAAPQSL